MTSGHATHVYGSPPNLGPYSLKILISVPLMIFFFSSSILQASAQLELRNECSETNRTSYLRSEGLRIEDMPKATLTGITLNQCAEKCTQKAEGVSCHAFEYNALSQSCALTEAEGQPFGTAFLVRTHEPGVAFFQQICIPTTELCESPYAFERYPQHVLVGSAMEVRTTNGLSECLRLCLEAKQRLRMDCRSVMFFYETGECILNRDMAKEYPNMFTNDTQFHLVDYFENNCFDISCFDHSSVHWVRSESYHIGVEKDVIMAGISAEECKKACLENRVETEVFPCRGYTYSGNKQECHLTAESALITDSVMEISGDSRLSLELSSISAGQYFEKYCIPGNIRCAEASFEFVPGRMLDATDKEIRTKSIGECFHACLSAGAECDSLMYFREEHRCVLNKKSQFSYPELFKPSPNVDYYDNICEYVPGTLSKSETLATKSSEKSHASFDVKTNDNKPLSSEKLNKEAHESEALVPLKSTNSNTLQQQAPTIFKEPKQPERIKGTLETECKLDGIVMIARFETATSGALFIKDHSATCRKVFESALEARLEIPYPSSTFSNPECPGVELAPNLWSFIVVIQKNNIGIPSLMTGTDRIFNVTCDYSNVVQYVKNPNTTANATATTIKPQKDDPGERIRMAIFRDGKPVTTVSLGEELELRWIYNKEAAKNDPTPYGFFIDECIAERLDGSPPDPAPLPLVTKGCPDPKVRNRLMRYPIIEVGDGFSTRMKVFRFDGSRRVRIRCAVNICVERCAPVVCEMTENGSHSVKSYGRKRRQTLDDLSQLLKQFDQTSISSTVNDITTQRDHITVTLDSFEAKIPNQVVEQSMISGAYTIIDDDEKEPRISPTQDSSSSRIRNLDEIMTTEEPKAMTKDNCDYAFMAEAEKERVCVLRTALIGMVVTLALMGSINLFIIVNCFYARYRQRFNDLPSPISTLTSTSSSKSVNSKSSGSSSTEFYTTYFEGKTPTERENDLRSFLSLASIQTKDSPATTILPHARKSKRSHSSTSKRSSNENHPPRNVKEYNYMV